MRLRGEPTLERFYERLLPFATPFMALFGRSQLPHRSVLSRFLSALDQPTVEGLRSLFEEDLLARPLTECGEQRAGLWDRCGERWLVFDEDATRQAARQRALPATSDLPPVSRRMDAVCAPGYTGRKRGEVVRTRTTLLQAHTQQWFGTYGKSGNGDYRWDLLRSVQIIMRYALKENIPLAHIILRLDGQYGDLAVVIDLASNGLCFLTRGKNYDLLDLPAIQARLALSPDEVLTHPETGTCRALFDCPHIPLPGTALTMRVIVATHPQTAKAAPIGVTRDGVVSELFFTALPQATFTPADVVNLYLHRGAFEVVLSDEDQEQNPDRWVSHSPSGQEFWQVISQWMWNLRLELGHRLHPTPMRTTQFAQAREEPLAQPSSEQPAPLIYGPPEFAGTKRAGKFAATDFLPQPDATLRCPADHPLYAQARRKEHDGAVRILYAASLTDCRGCPVRHQCQGDQTKGPRHVSAVVRPMEGPCPLPEPAMPLAAPTHPILWGDWSRRQTRRAFIRLLRTQTVRITVTAVTPPSESTHSGLLTREQRAHWRLSWAQRLARNALPSEPMHRTAIHLFGIPPSFARSVGLAVA